MSLLDVNRDGIYKSSIYFQGRKLIEACEAEECQQIYNLLLVNNIIENLLFEEL